MNRKTITAPLAVFVLAAGLGVPAISRAFARQGGALSEPDRQATIAEAVERARALLKTGDAEPAVRLLLPMRSDTDDPAFLAAFSEALARAAYQRSLALESRGSSPPATAPGGRAGDDQWRDELKRADESIERSIKDIDRRLDTIDRTLSDKGRAEPITDRLEQSTADLKRDVRDLKSQLDRLERTVEQLRWKK